MYRAVECQYSNSQYYNKSSKCMVVQYKYYIIWCSIVQYGITTASQSLAQMQHSIIQEQHFMGYCGIITAQQQSIAFAKCSVMQHKITSKYTIVVMHHSIAQQNIKIVKYNVTQCDVVKCSILQQIICSIQCSVVLRFALFSRTKN